MDNFIIWLWTAINSLISVLNVSVSYNSGNRSVSLFQLFIYILIFEVIIGALLSLSRVQRPRKHAKEGDSNGN